MSDSTPSLPPAGRAGVGPNKAGLNRTGLNIAGLNKIPIQILLFLILVIMVPIQFSISPGGLLLTPARVYLIVMAFVILPRLGRLQLFDWFFLGHVGWVCMAYLLIYGPGRVLEPAGSYVLEFAVVYLLARVYLQNPEQIKATIGVIFILVVLSAAFALPEAITGIRVVHEFATAVTGNVYRLDSEIRMGIYRAHSFFEHPILYGVFCAASFSLVWFASTPAQRLYRAPIIVFATWLSASSAPILMLLVQIALLVVERLTRRIRRRDKLLGWSAAAFVLLVETATGRGVVGLVTLMTLNPATAYTRRAQWIFAIDDVMRNPIFGFRPELYTRPFWLAPSIDNWWLLIMMRSGIPSLVLLALSALFLWAAIVRREGPPLFTQLRTAWGLMLIAIILGAATVTFFGKLQPLFAFYMGMGAALATCYLPGRDAAPEAAAEQDRPRYTRFSAGATVRADQGRARGAGPRKRDPGGRR